MNIENKRELRIISLFDGISVLQQSLKELNIKTDLYVAVEIDKFARKVTKQHFPNTVFYNDVRTFDGTKFKDIDLVVFGSNCQNLSSMNKIHRTGLAGAKSGLFWEAVRILNEVKPRFFLMENVASMKNTERLTISQTLNVEAIDLDSSLLGSPQRRVRYFWSNLNIPYVSKFEAKSGLTFQDIVENGFVRSKFSKTLITNQVSETESGLARALGLSKFGAVGNIIFKDKHVAEMEPEQILEHFKQNSVSGTKDSSTSFGKNGIFRVPSPVECERLMGLPDNYTNACSMTQRYKQLGNAFCTHHIKFILEQNMDLLLK